MYQTISNFNSSLPLSNWDVTINHTIESKEREDPEVTINNENISRSIPRHSNKKSSGSASKPKNVLAISVINFLLFYITI